MLSRLRTYASFVRFSHSVFALPFALGSVGGVAAFSGAALPATFTDLTYSSGPGSGWAFLALTGPAFVISPGFIQKSYGA